MRWLADRLIADGHTVWVDWKSIPHSAEWWSEVERGIESSAAYVFVLSPDSVRSQICIRELAHAESGHARIIPIVRRSVDDEPVPKSLAARNWIFMRESDDADATLAALVDAISTDLEEERLHARLRVRATEWEAGGRKRSSLLRGDELAAAEQSVAAAIGRVGQAERQYVLASRGAVGQFQRRVIAAAATALIVAIGLSIVALVSRQQAVEQEHAARSRALAASSLLALKDDPELSLLLAREAARVRDTQQARQALREALSSSHVRLTMKSPTGALMAARLTRGGRQVLTFDSDGPVHLFDAETARHVRAFTVRRYRRTLVKATLSSDGTHALIVPNIGPPVVFDLAGRAPPVTLRDPSSDGWYSDAAIDREGRLAVANELHTEAVRIFDARGGALLRKLPGKFGAIALSDHGQVLALASSGTVTTYAGLSHPRRLATLHLSPRMGYPKLAFVPDGSLLTVQGEVRLWNPLTGQPRARLGGLSRAPGQSEAVGAVAFSSDGRWAIGTSGGRGAVWDTVSGRRRTEIVSTGGSTFRAAALSPDGAHAVTASTDGVARVWDATTGTMLAELRGVAGGVNDVAFDASGRRVLTAGDDGTARIWDAGLGLPLSRRRAPPALRYVTVHPPSRWATGFSPGDTAVSVLDARSGRQVFSRSLPAPARAVGFADVAPVMAVAYDHRPAELYDLRRARSIGSPHGAGAVADDVVLSADGRRLMTGRGNLMTVWDVPALRPVGRLSHRFGGSSLSASATSFSPDGGLLATVGDDGVAILWRSSDGRIVATTRGEPSPGFNASATVKPAFSADSKLFVAAGNWQRQPSVRRTIDGRQVATLTQPLNSVAFSPTAPLVVTDGAFVWDAESGRRLLELRDTSTVDDPIFTADGLRVVGATGSDAEATFACDVCGPLHRLTQLADQRITRDFSAAERDRYLR